MKKLSLIALTTTVILLGGCATPAPKPEVMTDVEPLLVGKPIGQRVFETSGVISEQLALLNRVQLGQNPGLFSIVEHNNQLDARKNSSRTIPEAYAKKEVQPTAMPSNTANIKRILWENNSLNELSNGFAKALGYELVIKSGAIKDININFLAQNMSLVDAIEKLKVEVKPFAEIIVVPNNKTINILYK